MRTWTQTFPHFSETDIMQHLLFYMISVPCCILSNVEISVRVKLKFTVLYCTVIVLVMG